ncbi:double-strand break repair helicase AddA [Bosea sp. 117]|uniref:double-strand break repair helicase AddA n=1 Tax=Bosea sp. 117 TaxID=1125973 RepID=UPI000494AFC3|nr:double-strand break repair helicase AddA [Bosea sp. 117]
MNAPAPASAAIEAATALQSRASDPAISAWVSANAGSGKTHVLARRVIRLLLGGVPPGRILCLTYTKAAAANMANRVLDELRRWVTLDDETLDAAIRATDGAPSQTPAPERRARARRLFAAALETPGGLKIQTIHAFCGQLLHRFPFEAGVPAGFGTLENGAELELLARVRTEVVLEAAGAPDSPLGRAFALIVEEMSDGGIDKLVAGLIAEPDALDASEDDVRRLVGCTSPECAEEIERRIVGGALIPHAEWRPLGQVFMQLDGRITERGAALVAAALAGEEERAGRYAEVFLTKDSKPRADSQFGKAEIRADYPVLLTERDRIGRLMEQITAARAAERSIAALTIARAAVARYETAKRARGVLDFGDLIKAARKLLGSGASAWVHYKLDQGIDHVLLDEAQDTSPEQWEVIRPLVAEFFAGAGAHTETRTLFVVGDEKQSIFSFQGADPRRFNAMREELARTAPAASFDHVKLRHSFRSAPGIMAAVDTVFGREEAFHGLTAEPEATSHEAVRNMPSLVEIWTPEAPGEKAEVDAWQKPLDAPREDDPKTRLARNIAAHIGAYVKVPLPLAARDAEGSRAARPGDFLILVRRRDALFEAIIRELKNAGVPVAGADRLIVAEHIAVMDLMALGDALVSPDDELSLACALKSPLFGLDDNDLIALCARRTARLGETLRARAGEKSSWGAAAAMLERLRPDALALRPFDFYARVLGRERGRAKMLARLGEEAADALDEMLALARTYERVETPSLPGFLAFLRRGGADTKRDMEAGRDEVRVMTVHGAKGLEAPYVILADTTTLPNARNDDGLIKAETESGRRVALLAPSKKTDTPALATLRDRLTAAAHEEYRRLLYVALTRAETALVVCGADGRNQRRPECWYELVRAALAAEAVEAPAIGFDGQVLRWRPQPQGSGAPGSAPSAAPPMETLAAEERHMLERMLRPVAASTPPRRVVPSALETQDQAPRAASARSAADRLAAAHSLRRGDLVHRLLAGLPGIEPPQRREAGGRLLANLAADLGDDIRAELVEEALATLDHPALAKLFAPGSRAEVPVAGEIAPGVTVSGRIDRVHVAADRVLIADFKTDARPPQAAGQVPATHRAQLALYAHLIGKLFPDRAIDAVLVYTAGPVVHEVLREAVAAAVSSLTSE